jgi:hypothetical protein
VADSCKYGDETAGYGGKEFVVVSLGTFPSDSDYSL